MISCLRELTGGPGPVIYVTQLNSEPHWGFGNLVAHKESINSRRGLNVPPDIPLSAINNCNGRPGLSRCTTVNRPLQSSYSGSSCYRSILSNILKPPVVVLMIVIDTHIFVKWRKQLIKQEKLRKVQKLLWMPMGGSRKKAPHSNESRGKACMLD